MGRANDHPGCYRSGPHMVGDSRLEVVAWPLKCQ